MMLAEMRMPKYAQRLSGLPEIEHGAARDECVEDPLGILLGGKLVPELGTVVRPSTHAAKAKDRAPVPVMASRRSATSASPIADRETPAEPRVPNDNTAEVSRRRSS